MLGPQFEDALTRIEISGEKQKRVQRAHTEVRALLELSERLQEWGVDTTLIGSYSRDTAIFPGKDVDIFCKFLELDTSVSPRGVYEEVRRVLSGAYGDQAEPRPRSIRIGFGDDFFVDVVPAVKSLPRWAIPARDQELWNGKNVEAGWVVTDPERLNDLTNKRNRVIDINGQGAYVPLIKLVRQIRKHHLGDQPPDGHYFELLVYWEFDSPPPSDSWSEALTGLLEGTGKRLASATALVDPCLDTEYAPAPSADDLASAAQRVSELAELASSASELEECPAAAIWRRIIGSNPRGACFPLPRGCDEDGNRIPSIVANPARGRQEARGFGCS